MLYDMWLYFTEINGFVQFIIFMTLLEIVALPFRALVTWVKTSNRRILITGLANKGYTPENINKTLKIMNKEYDSDE